MRIAIAGATGNIGARTAVALERYGHDVVRISRSLGVDLVTGGGLDAALAGVEAVVDAISAPPTDRDSTIDYFGTTTRNLLAAEHRAGVGHHVLLSIVGIHDIEGNAHYSGKREQERLVADGPVPSTIVPATQFYDFAAMVAFKTARGCREGDRRLLAGITDHVGPDSRADRTRRPGRETCRRSRRTKSGAPERRRGVWLHRIPHRTPRVAPARTVRAQEHRSDGPALVTDGHGAGTHRSG